MSSMWGNKIRISLFGESHGPAIGVVVDGLPSGVELDLEQIAAQMRRRAPGNFPWSTTRKEADEAEVLSGFFNGKTCGTPLAAIIRNTNTRSVDYSDLVTKPRPGHADLAGMLKYDLKDARDILERASARETVARVSAGAVAKTLLAEFGIKITSHVVIIGGVHADPSGLGINQIITISEKSPVRCADPDASRSMCKEIEAAGEAGDTLGGMFEVIIHGVPPGLGSHTQWDRRLDGNIAKAIMSIQAVKGVGFGMGFDVAQARGSAVHDEIFYDKNKGFYRNTNNSGGIEGGMSNGEDIIIRAAMKPISTLKKPLSSVNVKTKKKVLATVERSDVCAVPAAGVIGEAVSAIEIAGAMLEKFGCDSIREMKRNFNGYIEQVRKF